MFHNAAATLPGAYQQIRQLGRSRARDGVEPPRRGHEAADRVDRRTVTDRGRGATVFHELDPTLYSVTSSTFVGRVYALFGLRNIADAAKAGGSDYPQLSPEYVIASTPT